MNIENLANGLIIKNYKELCLLVNEPIKTGKSKQLQLKEYERYFNYEKQGNKFIIKEIYEIPIPKEDGRINNKGGNNNKYNDYIEKLIMYELSKRPLSTDGKIINMSRNGLYLQLHMINGNYNMGRNNINKFSRYLKIPINCLYDFFNNTTRKLQDNVERTLNKLQRSCLIRWEYRMQVKLNSGTHRLATDDEINIIVECERQALITLYEKDKKDIFLKGKWNKFSQEVSDLLQEKSDIQYYYKVFHINTTKDFREMLIESDDLESIQNELNATIYLSSIETAERHHNSMIEKWRGSGNCFGIPGYDGEKVALRPQYIDDTKKIAEKVIDWDTYIMKFDQLDNISNEKYTLMEAIINEEDGDIEIPFLDDFLDGLLK